MGEGKRIVKASWWEGLAVGKTGCCSVVRPMLSKSSIQYSVDGSGGSTVFLSVVCPEA